MIVKFQIERGCSTSNARSRCVDIRTGEVLAVFAPGALCLESLNDIKHRNRLLKHSGFKIVKQVGTQYTVKQIDC